MVHSMRLVQSLAAAVVVPVVLAACAGSGQRTLDPRTWFSRDTTPGPAVREVPGVDARLASLGSAVTGVVRARESGDLLVVRIELTNSKPGTAHRVVLHANGNCSSPNGFSAGAPWSPPGWKDQPSRLVPDVYTNSEGNGILTARVRGVRLGDLEKRGVLVYEGGFTEPPRPSVSNNVVACGVFERATSLFQS
jgi:Cu/Zn superoxide dismutase